MRQRAILGFTLTVVSAAAIACASSSSSTLEPPGPSPAPSGTATIEFVDGGRLYALVVQTDAAGAVTSSRLAVLNVRDFSDAGGRDLGTIDASAIAVDASAEVFVANRTDSRIDRDGVPFLTVGAPPDDVAVAGPVVAFSDRLFSLAAASAAGVDLYEEDSFLPQSPNTEHLVVGGSPRAVAFGSLASLGVAAQASAATLAVVSFGNGEPAHILSTAPVGDASCPASADDVASGGSGYLVWDAGCERAYGSGAPVIFGSAGTAGLGSNARLRAASSGSGAVAGDGNRLDFFGGDGAAFTVPLPSRVTSVAAADDTETAWAALDEPGAPRIASVSRSGSAPTFTTLSVPGIVRDLEYRDRHAEIVTSVDSLDVDACRGPTTVSFHVSASDADGDPVTLYVSPIPGATFNASTGIYTATFSKNDGVASIPLQAASGRYLVTKNLSVYQAICLQLDFCQCSTTSGSAAAATSAVAAALGALAVFVARRFHAA